MTSLFFSYDPLRQKPKTFISDELFQQHTFPTDREQWRFSMLFWSMAVVVFVAIDFCLYGKNSQEYPLIPFRLAAVILTITLWMHLPRCQPTSAQRWVIAWVMLTNVLALLCPFIYARDFFVHYAYDVLALIFFFATFPLKLVLQIVLSSTFVVCSLVILMLYKQAPSPSHYSNTAYVLILTLGAGILISHQLHVYKRNAFDSRVAAEMQAKTDALTGLLNRRGLQESLESHESRNGPFSAGIAFIMIDIDNFKIINDLYGHSSGDAILCSFTGRASSCIRSENRFTRLGGEEFCLVIDNCPLQAALNIAERLRYQTMQAPFFLPNGQPYELTISVGVSVSRDGENSIDHAMRRADASLYLAKQRGRNRVECTA
jgi:diguanylate cyclase (GGDEF)-like protein